MNQKESIIVTTEIDESRSGVLYNDNNINLHI